MASNEIFKHLEKAGLNKFKRKCQGLEMDGAKVKKLMADDLKELGISDPTEQLEILNVINNKNQPKLFNDPIHGSIKLHPLLAKIIDTPEFQRLRNIKQLGVVCYVYPGARHTHFEHSIGVAHLAGDLAQALIPRPNKEQKKDILCVQIAGLCRDLGCGPFPLVSSDQKLEFSVNMFNRMVEKNCLKSLMKFYGVENKDLIFIRELINPELGKSRPKEMFLYEIVSNTMNSIDADTFDSVARDCYYLGIKNSFDYPRFKEFVKLCDAKDGTKHISIKDKEVDNLCDLFYTMYRLHKRAYQHRVTKAIKIMMKDAFPHEEILHIEGSDKKLGEKIKDLEFLLKLIDCLFPTILNSVDPNLKEASEILQRIHRRDLYEYLGEVTVSEKIDVTFEAVSEQTDKYKNTLIKSFCKDDLLTPKDFEIVDIPFKKGRTVNVYFYTKSDDTAIMDKVFKVLPDYFCETGIRVYLKKTDQMSLKESAKERFREWCSENYFQPEEKVPKPELELDDAYDMK